ncbi:GlxA family transcriptional regulator [Candidatus Pantoea formicae]|uniref:GlxA family transcriptional regulator n=1 Tax=Candidatus Pantoea formicae TaxID=2608355 RepID=UPI003EDAFA1C
MHHIVFFVCEGYETLDLAGPLTAFSHVLTVKGSSPYALHVVSHAGGEVAGNAGLTIQTAPFADQIVDTVIFIGGDLDGMQAQDNVSAALQLCSRSTRIASVCTGAFLLAKTGLLNGRRATTHWRYAARLQSHFPEIKVNADSIFITDGPVWTSAGIAAAIDLSLAVIEKDLGSGTARAIAKHLVVPYRRPGGQSQYSAMSQMEPDSDRIRMALAYARSHLGEALPIERLAEAASLSPRQFGRVFRRETGETPAKAVERLRVETARLRLQDGSEPIEKIANAVGFTDPERMRRAFIRLLGHPPQTVRRADRLNKTE